MIYRFSAGFLSCLIPSEHSPQPPGRRSGFRGPSRSSCKSHSSAFHCTFSMPSFCTALQKFYQTIPWDLFFPSRPEKARQTRTFRRVCSRWTRRPTSFHILLLSAILGSCRVGSPPWKKPAESQCWNFSPGQDQQPSNSHLWIWGCLQA